MGKKKTDPINEDVLRRLQRLEGGSSLDISSWYKSPAEKLPQQFKFPEITKYDGNGSPKAHIMSYMCAMKNLNLSDDLMAHFFSQSLTGYALEWIIELDQSRYPTWAMLAEAFIRHFVYGTEGTVTRRQLESMRQEDDESFTDFIARWRLKVREMINRPSEEEQLKILRNSVKPNIRLMLSIGGHDEMDRFILAGTHLEDSMKNGTLASLLAPIQDAKSKKVGKEHVNQISFANKQQNMAQGIQSKQQVQKPYQVKIQANQQAQVQRPKRELSRINHPLSAMLPGLVEAGLITLLEPRPVRDPPPTWFNPNQHCDYHQGPGHLTDKCWNLRHVIQDLLEEGKIQIEGVQLPARPNINTNPLPVHQATGHQNVNYVGSGSDASSDPSESVRRRDTTNESPVQKSLQGQSIVYQVGEASQMAASLDESIAKSEKAKMGTFKPQLFTILKKAESPKKQLFTVVKKAVQTPLVFRLDDLRKPTMDVREFIVPKSQDHLWSDPLKEVGTLECQEVQHQTRAGTTFKPANLRADNPAAAVRVQIWPSAMGQSDQFDHGNRKIAYLMQTQRYFPGMGLGRNLHRLTEPLSISQRVLQDTFRLGYQPTEAEIARSNPESSRRANAARRGEQHISPGID
ncbi:hypothetical protein BVC80_741g10 [Macleaya cordata]|uniref:Retrotransposon gag domain-containing protein n=1 Tax=Macleaya cordata TaxID=56857 RepID=A0A200QN70_MACCD|nr:hypothetical protein BVC80_741g10 [Macleaya cordata]